MDNLTRRLYKKYHLCLGCGVKYGDDTNKEANPGYCPKCSRKVNNEK